jgi:hypothetical protein
MKPSTTIKGQERVNFWISKALDKKVKWAEKEFDFSRSEIFRQAVAEFIAKLERDVIDREVEEACAFYRSRDKALAKDWRSAEGTV